MIQAICPTQSRVWIKRGAKMIDVREPDEVERVGFEVKDCINLPLSKLPVRFKELSQTMEIVLVCQDGRRSLQALHFLLQEGYNASYVVHMKDGLERWVSKGFPVTGDPGVLGDLSRKFTCGGKGNCC